MPPLDTLKSRYRSHLANAPRRPYTSRERTRYAMRCAVLAKRVARHPDADPRLYLDLHRSWRECARWSVQD